MKHLAILSLLLGMVIGLTSCNNFSNSLLSASATTSEALVLMEDAGYNGVAGEAVKDLLKSPVKGLPQIEPNFTIIQVTPQNFSSTFKMVRNIVIPEISNIYTKPSLKADLDKYAMGQLILQINAPDTATFVKFITENKEDIVNYILQKELTRTASFVKQQSGTAQGDLQEMFGINFYYPKGIPNIVKKTDFYWATNNAPQARKDVVVYQYPYKSEKQFELDSLVKRRNEFLGKYIKGSYNSQMTTATKSYTPDYRRITADGLFRAEFRGLWEMTTDMMGGPFVSQAIVNPITNKIVVAEVFVFAPESDKRNLIRNLEASLYTLSIYDPAKANAEKDNKKK